MIRDTRDRYTVTRLPAPKKGINIINGQKVVMNFWDITIIFLKIFVSLQHNFEIIEKWQKR